MADKKAFFEELAPDMLEGVAGGVITPETEILLRLDLAEVKKRYTFDEAIDIILKYSDKHELSELGTTPEEVADYARTHWGDI